MNYFMNVPKSNYEDIMFNINILKKWQSKCR